MNVRKTALDLLCRAEDEKRYINLSLSHALPSCESKEDKHLLSALLYGVTEKRVTLDYYISAISMRSGDKIESRTKNILRIGLYQLMYMDKIPAFAAVNESVKLTKNKGEAAFVNGVLRAYERKKSELSLPSREKNAARHLSVRYSFPLPIVKHFISEYGEKEAQEILEAFCRQAHLSLRTNTQKITRDELLSKLRESSVNAVEDELSPNGIIVYDSISPVSLYGFENGLFFVQDTASQLECEVLPIKEGDFLIDVCACPGGKSFGAAIKMKDKGRVLSLDLHESKLPLIEEGARRLSLESIEVKQWDSTKAIEKYIGQADCVICDVPCSGLGVLAKKPDLRYRELNFDELCELSFSILRASAEYVKNGGCLVYSTCTLNKRENEDAVLRFLAENKSFSPAEFTVGGKSSKDGMLTLLPHKDGRDGFFIAKLIKK